MGQFWKTPAEYTAASLADRVEVLAIRGRRIVPAADWPERFWDHVERRLLVSNDDAEMIVSFFCGLEPGEPARCHDPPWGIAFYKGDALLLATTICFHCSNVHVFTEHGRDLRAFDAEGTNATNLRKLLERVTETSE